MLRFTRVHSTRLHFKAYVTDAPKRAARFSPSSKLGVLADLLQGIMYDKKLYAARSTFFYPLLASYNFYIRPKLTFFGTFGCG